MSEKEVFERTISLMNTIAIQNPTMLDTIMTDEVLKLAHKNLDLKMKNELENYKFLKKLTCFEYVSQKEFNDEVIKLIVRNLLSLWNLYVTYETIKKARGIELELETDINSVLEILEQEGLKEPPKTTTEFSSNLNRSLSF